MSAESENKDDNLLENAASTFAKLVAREHTENLIDNKFFVQSGITFNKPFDSNEPQIINIRKKVSNSSSVNALPTTFYNAPTEVITSSPEIDERETKVQQKVFNIDKLRYLIVFLTFLFAVTWSAIDIQQIFSKQSSAGDWTFGWKNKRLLILSVNFAAREKLQINDEILAINEDPVATNKKGRLTETLWSLSPGDTFILKIKRADELHLVEMKTEPLSTATIFNQYTYGVFAPVAFYTVGLLIFLFRPNDKKTFLLSLGFGALGVMVAPKLGTYDVQLSPFFSFLWRSGIVLVHLGFPVFLHFYLVFPEKLNFVRRFPSIERFIYLPFLVYVVPVIALWQLNSTGFTQLEDLEDVAIIGGLANLIVLLSLFASVIALLLNYLQTDENGKRRLRFLGVGIVLSIVPSLFNYAMASFDPFSNAKIPHFGVWQELVFLLPTMLLPFIYAYAIVRYRILPISFIVRRGLQYLLAKNALRLLIVLPILGIVWNVISNQNRTLDEIVFNNSATFYLLFALTIGLGLLIRFRLNNWIDRIFFRAQYNQERILRELIEAVRKSDSLQKLSRLISSKIEMALHPKSIHLFFQNSDCNDYSLEYSSAEKTQNIKLSAGSNLLQFMQRIEQAIDFPSLQIAGLPKCERDWLISLDANLLVPMRGSDKQLAGFFSLGEKKSEIPYTRQDRNLLETLAHQIAFVYENLALRERVYREQTIKTQVLSRFEEGNINLLKECPVCGRCFDRIFERCIDDNAELTFTLPVERIIENRYCLEKLIGKGGMGTVYESVDQRLNRLVAVKILSNTQFGNQSALRRFEREARTIARLHHPNIVTVFDYGVLSTQSAFLVMELVRGASLASVIKRQGKLSVETTVNWFRQILDGVEAAHQAAIVHRDLKPQNVLVVIGENNETRLCLLDFGLARTNEQETFLNVSVTMPGTILGTFGYMPLEQMRGEKTDERSDLFAVGAMLYEALHGQTPFRGTNYHELLQTMSKDLVLNKEVLFPEFFKSALAREPEKRFRSAAEMKSALLNLSLDYEIK